jgi:hypothetical protein
LSDANSGELIPAAILTAITLLVPGLGKELLDPAAAFGDSGRLDNGAETLGSNAFQVFKPGWVGEKTIGPGFTKRSIRKLILPLDVESIRPEPVSSSDFDLDARGHFAFNLQSELICCQSLAAHRRNLKNGKQKMENENEKWKMKNGKWKMEMENGNGLRPSTTPVKRSVTLLGSQIAQALLLYGVSPRPYNRRLQSYGSHS